MIKKERKLWIGTSGWHYPHWKTVFYPPKTQPRDYLKYYLNYFPTVEINNSFYRLPSPETFSAWKEAVPDDFLFAVKANRYITHMKKLKDPQQSLEKLLCHVDFLDEKLGPILFQLPPSWNLNLERLTEFIETLPAHFRYTFEFRNHSWYCAEVYDLLHQHNIAFCVYELARHLSPVQLTANFVYVRLHGPGGNYEGSYSDKTLQEWAHQAMEWNREGKDVFIYFDNDQNAYAAHNARTLNKLAGTML